MNASQLQLVRRMQAQALAQVRMCERIAHSARLAAWPHPLALPQGPGPAATQPGRRLWGESLSWADPPHLDARPT